MKKTLALLALSLALPCQAAGKLPPDHPLLGSWELDVPGQQCTEFYLFKSGGNSLVRSNEEVAEASFEVAGSPSTRGYYKYSDRVTRDNGQPDCTGKRSKPGTKSTLFLRFNDNSDIFVMCRDESLRACIGPFRRAAAQSM